jgi:poly(hydroxyalkanoate) depolymerase family esterase
MKAHTDFLLQMREATALLQSNGPAAATAAIQRALGGMPVTERSRVSPQGRAPLAANDRVAFNPPPAREAPIIDVEIIDAPTPGREQFLKASLRNQAGTRDYKLFVPSTYNNTNNTTHPLIVMLHGCKQNPDDFAIGTQMNEIAEEYGCLVVYPAQAQAKNMSNCWNWFSASDQQRNMGEPSIIADITRRVMDEYHVDHTRVYVAGLSAGGAMAAIMGKTYPEIFAAIGVHSGLPVGAAHDVASAFGAMKNGASPSSKHYANSQMVARPIIVFHGDRDTTVHPKNAAQVLSQFATNERGDGIEVIAQDNQTTNGRTYDRIVYRNSGGKAIAEQWLIHGAGHAWSGGSIAGSYSDAKGPVASREMLRFFLANTNLG